MYRGFLLAAVVPTFEEPSDVKLVIIETTVPKGELAIINKEYAMEAWIKKLTGRGTYWSRIVTTSGIKKSNMQLVSIESDEGRRLILAEGPTQSAVREIWNALDARGRLGWLKERYSMIGEQARIEKSCESMVEILEEMEGCGIHQILLPNYDDNEAV